MTDQNPYSPPPAPSAPPAARVTHAGEFTLGGIIGDAWALSSGCKAVFLAVYFAVFAALWLVQIVAGGIVGRAVIGGGSTVVAILWQLVLAALLYPFLASVMNIALRRADGHAVTLGDALGHGVSFAQLSLLGVLMTLATMIGFGLLVLPGIYLSVAFMFALPLVVDRRLAAIEALKTSLAIVHPHWFRCAGLLLVLGLMIALGAMTVIGLIWVLPVSSLALALAYRRFFAAAPAGEPAVAHGLTDAP